VVLDRSGGGRELQSPTADAFSYPNIEINLRREHDAFRHAPVHAACGRDLRDRARGETVSYSRTMWHGVRAMPVDPAFHCSANADCQADVALGFARTLKQSPRDVDVFPASAR
jgi:hypothetical protein